MQNLLMVDEFRESRGASKFLIDLDASSVHTPVTVEQGGNDAYLDPHLRSAGPDRCQRDSG